MRNTPGCATESSCQELHAAHAKIISLEKEVGRATAGKLKLEALCRELQKQNKEEKEGRRQALEEEIQRRLEMTGKFQDSLKDIAAKVEEQGEARQRVAEENDRLRSKVANLQKQLDIMTQQAEQQAHTKTLELKVAELRLEQQGEIARGAEAKSSALEARLLQAEEAEKKLREQLDQYHSKFEQFQSVMKESSDVYSKFKEEAKQMTKHSRRLEQENISLKEKCKKADVALLEILTERDNGRTQLATVVAQKGRLEALCRSMQAERKVQMQQQEQEKDRQP